jgi:hypothetical protein
LERGASYPRELNLIVVTTSFKESELELDVTNSRREKFVTDSVSLVIESKTASLLGLSELA